MPSIPFCKLPLAFTRVAAEKLIFRPQIMVVIATNKYINSHFLLGLLVLLSFVLTLVLFLQVFKMSEHARKVPPQDPISKMVRRRCKEVTDFIERDETTEDEDCSDDSDNSDLQSILDKMEAKEVQSNKTFPEDKLREIERRNAILMNKLIKSSQRPNQYGCTTIPTKLTSAAINRRRQQEKINRDNLVTFLPFLCDRRVFQQFFFLDSFKKNTNSKTVWLEPP